MNEYPAVSLPGLKTLEAEKGEVIVTPDKAAYAIGGKSHKQGGTPLVAEAGSYILSKALMLDKETVSALGYGKKEMSPAALSKKAPTIKYMDIIDDTTGRYDDLAKKTAALMLEKNAARQDLIFYAQESQKADRGMRNDLEMAERERGRLLFETGGPVTKYAPPKDLSLPPDAYPGMFDPEKFRFDNVPNYIAPAPGDIGAGKSYTTASGIRMYDWRPLGNDPYLAVQKDILDAGGKLTPTQKKVLGERQQRLSTLRSQFPNGDGEIIEKEYAKYLKAADAIEKDQFLDKFVTLADGREVPLSEASEQDIDKAKSFRWYNKRTGKNDLVDYRDRQNQGFDPVLTYQYSKQAPTDPFSKPMELLPTLKPAPVDRQGSPLPVPTDVPAATAKGEVGKGLDWQSIINGTQMGLKALDLMAIRTKAPYYDYRPSEFAYTRFEPLNTKQQERAFNLGVEAINRSALPGTLKAAHIANMQAALAEGASQVDLANYQAKLANDNRNVTTFNAYRNNDIEREQRSNLNYIAEADRREFEAEKQRQITMKNILDTWRTHVANRRDIRLVNQLSRNYDYNFNNEAVGYVAGQGVPFQPDNLQAFAPPSQRPAIDPSFLNEAGRKAYGYE